MPRPAGLRIVRRGSRKPASIFYGSAPFSSPPELLHLLAHLRPAAKKRLPEIGCVQYGVSTPRDAELKKALGRGVCPIPKDCPKGYEKLDLARS